MTVRYHSGKFPPVGLDWPRLLPLIGPANAAIARYEGVLHGISNPNVLLSPLTAQGRVLSLTYAQQRGLHLAKPAFTICNRACRDLARDNGIGDAS